MVKHAFATHDQLAAPGNSAEKPLGWRDTLNVGISSSYVGRYYAGADDGQAAAGVMGFTSSSGLGSLRVRPGLWRAQSRTSLTPTLAIDLKDYNVAALS